MALVRPFAALRPAEKFVEKVISPPYDVLSRKEAAELASANPFSFLHICRSEIDLPHIEDPYHPAVYRKAGANLNSFEKQGIMVRDKSPCFYIYRQTFRNRTQTGIVACLSIDEYMDNKIKKHELTRVDKEVDRINHFDACNANTEPVFLTYRHRPSIDDILKRWTIKNFPVYNFSTDDGVGHKLWPIDCKITIESIVKEFEKIPNLYIADGHHRSASAAKVGLKRRNENPSYDGSEEFNFFMAVLFPDSDLHIFDYNRIIEDLNHLSIEKFLAYLSPVFEINKLNGPIPPERKHVFSMYLDGGWYRLIAKDHIISDHPIKGLDVSILQEMVLNPILGIEDPRTDNRIDFVGGIRGLEELETRVDKDMGVAFALYPISMDKLLTVADKNEIMPPKSTWFEPKLGSGLFVHYL